MAGHDFLFFTVYYIKRRDKSILLVLDNHKWHLSLGLLDTAKENGVVLFSFHSHSSHILNQLDRSGEPGALLRIHRGKLQ
jgi:hypothetical protein